MTINLVLGAGEIGGPLAQRLTARGNEVRVATRSGSLIAGTQSVRLDASDADAVSAAADGASTIFLATNPPYQRWSQEWPPIFATAIEAARRSGAKLVAMGNLYPYGDATEPMTEHSPEITTERKGLVRKAGWAAMREATESGDIRATEVRASDYFGARAGASSHLGSGFFKPLVAGKLAMVVGDREQLHSWSYIPDIVSTLVAAADHQDSWGRIWHVPSSAQKRTDIAAQIAALTGRPARVAGYPSAVLTALGLFSPYLREVAASSYQFHGAPFVIDARETSAALSVTATAWADAFETTMRSYQSTDA